MTSSGLYLHEIIKTNTKNAVKLLECSNNSEFAVFIFKIVIKMKTQNLKILIENSWTLSIPP